MTRPPSPSAAPGAEEPRGGGWWVALAAAIAAVPVVVATARAVAGGWLALGDNANFLIRARDVLTSHHPLLGTWTSASRELGVNVDNPGPLYFDLLAVPAKVGGDGGLAVGAAVLNLAAIAGIALFARRSLGVAGGLAAVLVTAVLAWSMGSELLFDPWQPHALLLPVLLFFVLVAAMMLGDGAALPVAALVASVIVQTHLSYTLLVPVLAAAGAVVLGVRHGRARPAGGVRLRPMVLLTVAVLAVAWAQPAFEQVAGPGPGNLGTILTHAGGAGEVYGPVTAVRMTAEVIALPPWWLRPSFRDAFVGGPLTGIPDHVELPTTTAAVAALTIVSSVLLLLTLRRRGAFAARLLAGLALSLVGLGVFTTALGPVTIFKVSPHQLRYLWPVGAFMALALLAPVVGAGGGGGRGRPAGWTRVALLVAVAVVAAATIPSWNPRAGPAADAAAIPVARRLLDDLDTDGLGQPVLADLSGMRFAEPWSGRVLAELQSRGIEFRVADEGVVGQLGPARRSRGDEPVRLFVREGDAAVDIPAGATRIGYASALSPAERAELGDLRHRAPATPAARRRLLELQRQSDRLTVAVFIEERAR